MMQNLKVYAYHALEILTSGKGVKRQIGGVEIRFPARWSRYYEADYEPETFAFFREHLKQGSTVLDIGAHIGLFAVVTARLVGENGKVFSFEPTPFTRNVLTEVVSLNNCQETVEVRGEAMSSKSGKTVFYDTGDTISNANSLVKTERSREEIQVDLLSIDDFVSSQSLTVNCIKIDVEGAELDVLRGAANTIMHSRPVIRLGLHPPFIKQNGQTLEDIWDVIQSYELVVESKDSIVEKSWFVEQPQLFDVNLLPK